jgi:hypothetical protein
VFVQPFPPTGSIYQAPKVNIDFHPVWSPDGGELIYVQAAASELLAAVKVTARGGLTFGEPVSLPARVTGSRISTQPRAFDILRDGRFVGVVDTSTTDGDGSRETPPAIRVMLNWFEELKRLVPN